MRVVGGDGHKYGSSIGTRHVFSIVLPAIFLGYYNRYMTRQRANRHHFSDTVRLTLPAVPHIHEFRYSKWIICSIYTSKVHFDTTEYVFKSPEQYPTYRKIADNLSDIDILCINALSVLHN
jgi:hypothetical protein